MKQAFGQRFLMTYAGVLTIAVVAALLSGFVTTRKDASFDTLTVHRINVVEPDGTLRMVLSDKDRFPGAIFKGKEYKHDRPAAGILFYNDEGTENGGLVFGGYMGRDGKPEWHGHLSFDKYMQDQALTIDAGGEGGQYAAGLKLIDRPDYPLTELMDLMERIKDQPEAQRKVALEKFRTNHPAPKRRLEMTRRPDGSVQLGMNDPEGRPRIMLKVADDGTPSIRTLDADGKVTGQLLPQPAD